MTKEVYSALCDEPGHVLVYMPGCNYGMALDDARRLLYSLQLAINAADLTCDDCGRKHPSVESSGCPDAVKHGKSEPATLCDDCFNLRNLRTTERGE